MSISAERIERAAIAMFDVMRNNTAIVPWEENFESAKKRWRDNARAALEADAPEIATLRTLIARAVEALEPFADAASSYDPDDDDDNHAAWARDFTIGSLRKARTLAADLRKAGDGA